MADPANCENKLCKPWRQWFICRWETMRKAHATPERPPEVDPCHTCLCAGSLCAQPCQIKTAWQDARRLGECL